MLKFGRFFGVLFSCILCSSDRVLLTVSPPGHDVGAWAPTTRLQYHVNNSVLLRFLEDRQQNPETQMKATACTRVSAVT